MPKHCGRRLIALISKLETPRVVKEETSRVVKNTCRAIFRVRSPPHARHKRSHEEPTNAAMPRLCREVILLIAEHLPLRDLRSLMLTCKAHYELIREYKHSIVKTKISRLISVPAARPLTDAVLSSKRTWLPRAVLAPATFAAVEELEHRARCADVVVRSVTPAAAPSGPLFLEPVLRMPILQRLTSPQWDRLVARLKDTFALVDRIADREATIRHSGCQLKPISGIGVFANFEDQFYDARQDFIKTLSCLDLAFLALLLDLTGPAHVDSLELPAVKLAMSVCKAFCEVILRHGTVSAYRISVDTVFDDYRHEMVARCVEIELWNTEVWEAHQWGPRFGRPPLKPLCDIVREAFPVQEVRPLVLEERRKEVEAFWEGWEEDDETDERWMFRIGIGEEEGEEDPTFRSIMRDPGLWLIRRWLESGD